MALIISLVVSAACLSLVLMMSGAVYNSTYAAPKLSKDELLVTLPPEYEAYATAPAANAPIVIPGVPVLQDPVGEDDDDEGNVVEPEPAATDALTWKQLLEDAVAATEAARPQRPAPAQAQEVAGLVQDLQQVLMQALEHSSAEGPKGLKPGELGTLTLPRFSTRRPAGDDLNAHMLHQLGVMLSRLQNHVFHAAEDQGFSVESYGIELEADVQQIARAARVLQLEAAGMPAAFSAEELAGALEGLGGLDLEDLVAELKAQLQGSHGGSSPQAGLNAAQLDELQDRLSKDLGELIEE